MQDENKNRMKNAEGLNRWAPVSQNLSIILTPAKLSKHPNSAFFELFGDSPFVIMETALRVYSIGLSGSFWPSLASSSVQFVTDEWCHIASKICNKMIIQTYPDSRGRGYDKSDVGRTWLASVLYCGEWNWKHFAVWLAMSRTSCQIQKDIASENNLRIWIEVRIHLSYKSN